MTCARCGRDPCACLADTALAEAPAPASAVQDRVGRTIGRYRVESRLGAGGMGVVYRATDTALGRPVALKFLAGASGADAQARLHREARAASALDHPNIGTVYEIGEDEGAPFIAMAFYEGETLRDRMTRGPIPVDETLAIAAQLASALAAAHRAGVLHRDLKPANIMITRGGVKLLDFGLAKLADPGEPLTQEGVVLGTLAYMAPEQLRAEAVDARADLWSLGAVLYEMVSGQAPFAAPTAASVATRILYHTPDPIRQPSHLGRLIMQLLDKKKEYRPVDADAVVQALATGRVIPRRRPRRRSIGLALIGVLAAGAGVLAWQSRVSDKRVAPPPPTAALVPPKLEPASKPAPPPLPTTPLTKAEQAQSQAKARALYDLGLRKFDLGKYDEGVTLFEGVYEIVGDPAILYNVAQSLRLAGQRERAREMYKSYLRRANKPSNRAEVEQRIRELSTSP